MEFLLQVCAYSGCLVGWFSGGQNRKTKVEKGADRGTGLVSCNTYTYFEEESSAVLV